MSEVPTPAEVIEALRSRKVNARLMNRAADLIEQYEEGRAQSRATLVEIVAMARAQLIKEAKP